MRRFCMQQAALLALCPPLRPFAKLPLVSPLLRPVASAIATFCRLVLPSLLLSTSIDRSKSLRIGVDLTPRDHPQLSARSRQVFAFRAPTQRYLAERSEQTAEFKRQTLICPVSAASRPARPSDAIAMSGSSFSRLSHLHFKRPKPKTLLIVGSIVGVASLARAWVYYRAKDALMTADTQNRQKIAAALEDDERRRNPTLDYDKIMRGVLEEEARIEKEEAEAKRTAIQKLQADAVADGEKCTGRTKII